MPLSPGTRIGPYEVIGRLGEGGMGEVHRARDTTLDRDVALKILPAAFAEDPDRLARLKREAKTLATLNHPHIAQIYGVEGGALVMELVEGEDMSERLARGPIPIDDALPLARQIAEAVEAAHEKGIVHRDLKPANIKVSGDGVVKILDFGLAKAYEGDASASAVVSLAHSPTMSRQMTEAGIILGTASYMAPEQARGAPVDKRADIWAFGVVVAEMLTGRRLFDGGTVSDVLAAVLRQEIDLASLPADTPAAIARLLARCLERDPKQRLRDIGEARVLLSAPLEPSRPAAAPRAPRARLARAWPWAIAAVASAIAALALWRTPAPAADSGTTTLRFIVPGPDADSGPSFSTDINLAPTLSPDGRMLALPLKSAEGEALFVRPLNGFELLPIEGGGRLPFFSPDARRLAFFRDATIWAVDLTDRKPALIGQVREVRWDLGIAAWHPDGRLLVPGLIGLWSVPAAGGEPSLLVAADAGKQERFTAVNVLDDGRLAVTVTTGDASRIEVFSSDARERRVVASGVEQGTLVEDVLLSRHSGQWRATRFDLRRLEPVGSSVPLSDVLGGSPLGRSIAWISGAAVARELVWVSREGAATPVGIAPAYLRWPRLSPDGTRVAFGSAQSNVAAPALSDLIRIGVIDLRTRRQTALDGQSEPVWLPDGRRVVTSVGLPPSGGLGEQVADGSRRMEPLFTTTRDAWPTAASADGAWFIYYGMPEPAGEATPDAGDLFVLDRKTQERRRLPAPGYQRGGRLSPDGRWLAFQSTDNYRTEVHVRPFPAFDANYRLSADGGEEPAWSADGKELFYRRGLDVMRVRVPAGESSDWPPAERLFSGNFVSDPYGDQSYDVASDGRFLMIRPVATARIDVHVVLNWLAEVRARLAGAQ
ncbi:MAG: protein kinase domain-containing protein [Acidobacteriota bacterium]